MTSTARRRWSRELTSEVDGIAFDATGPVLLHGYDPPPGGKWLDSVIPGKLGALDRTSGELLWMAPCEVGYGRGFGAGVGQEGQVLVLGPSTNGHRLVRMSMENGELLEAAEISPFDEAHVSRDLVICVTAGRVFAVETVTMTEAWEYSREGERYHHVERAGDRAVIAFSNRKTGRAGVTLLDAETGEFEGVLVSPSLPVIHGIAVTADVLLILTGDLANVLEGHTAVEFHTAIAEHPDGGVSDTLSVVALRIDGQIGDTPLWFRILETRPVDELPEVSISADSGKLYIEHGAYLEAVDAMTGRRLGEWTVPGLDDQVAWRVVDGAGLLAEETRVSIFELPA